MSAFIRPSFTHTLSLDQSRHGPLIHLFIYLLIHLLIHSFPHPSRHPFHHTSHFNWVIYTLIHAFNYSSTHLLIYLSTHLLILIHPIFLYAHTLHPSLVHPVVLAPPSTFLSTYLSAHTLFKPHQPRLRTTLNHDYIGLVGFLFSA